MVQSVPGRLAQWESASFTPKRSLVRTQYRPPGRAGPSTTDRLSHALRPPPAGPAAAAGPGPSAPAPRPARTTAAPRAPHRLQGVRFGGGGRFRTGRVAAPHDPYRLQRGTGVRPPRRGPAPTRCRSARTGRPGCAGPPGAGPGGGRAPADPGRAAAPCLPPRPSEEARWRRNFRSGSVRPKGAFITATGRPVAACSVSASTNSWTTGAGRRPWCRRRSPVGPHTAVDASGTGTPGLTGHR